jgi:hypothetical protein
MKIIFLDMDGVLCTNRAHIAQGGIQGMPNHSFMDALDREGVGMLTAIEKKCGDILYVLSSTWRKRHTKKEMEDWLRRYGWTGEFHPDWRTGELNGPRGLEIEEWLSRHPDTENYVILDDSGDMLESQKYHFVQTDDYNGIMAENYWHMERIFEKAMTYDTN